MNLLSDVITYVRRLIKSPSNSVISDNLIIDYINRFWIMDVDARVQLFDFKTTYQFQTVPGRIHYNIPLYNVQVEQGSQEIASYPVYQGFLGPVLVNGINIPFYTDMQSFYNLWPTYIQSLSQAGTGDGSANYSLSLPFFPAIPGYVDIAGIIATGSNEDPPVASSINTSIPSTSIYAGIYFTATASDGSTAIVSDSGQYLDADQNYGLLLRPGRAPDGNEALSGGYSTALNTVNYATGEANVTFTDASGSALAIPAGNPIQVQCYFYEQGIPRTLLFYNNCLTLLPPPDTSYLIILEAYLSPAAFLSSSAAVPFGYMSEYIARGAARKILSDTGDVEQFMFYEPLFREQETLVWKRSQRIFTSTRTPTIFSDLQFQAGAGNLGQGGI